MLSKISQISLKKKMCWSLFLRKLQAFRPANLFKKDSNTGIFLWNWQDFQTLFFPEHFWWLFFKISNSNILFKDFSGIPLRHSKSLITCNSHNDKLNLKNVFTYKKLFCKRFRTNSKGSDLNVNNFVVFFHFRIT